MTSHADPASRRGTGGVHGLWRTLCGHLNAQLAIDRLGITPVPVELRAKTRAKAQVALVVLYGLGWGLPVLGALQFLSGAVTSQSEQNVDEKVTLLGLQTSLLIVAVFMLKDFRRRPVPKSPAPPIANWTRLFTFFVAFLGPWVGMSLMTLLRAAGVPTIDYPYAPAESATNVWLEVLRTMMAGPLEETVLLGLVVVALRRGGYSWTIVCVVAVLVRVPFHLYYGWSALALSVWAVLMVGLYRRTGTLVPIALAHSTWNLLVYPVVRDAGGTEVLYACAGLAVVAVSVTFYRQHRQRAGAAAVQRPARDVAA